MYPLAAPPVDDVAIHHALMKDVSALTLLVAYMDRVDLLHHTIQWPAAENDKTGHTSNSLSHACKTTHFVGFGTK